MPGDALLYRGIELPHWREAFDGDRMAQVFLHYVDRDGPHRDWAYDKRARLAVSAASRRILQQLDRVSLTAVTGVARFTASTKTLSAKFESLATPR